VADWTDILGKVADIGANIYAGQLQKQQVRRANRAAAASTRDFPQLGMGLASTSPARGAVQMAGYTAGMPMGQVETSQAGYLRLGPGGLEMGDTMPSAVMPRGPQYAITQDANGRPRLLAIRSIGQPLLWSGDLAAVRRVAKVARKLGRFIHHRPR
jgi:hypothetical protein